MAIYIHSQDEEEDPEYRPSSGDSSLGSDESYIDMNIDSTEVADVEDIHEPQVTDAHENIVNLPSIVSHKNGSAKNGHKWSSKAKSTTVRPQ